MFTSIHGRVQALAPPLKMTKMLCVLRLIGTCYHADQSCGSHL